MAQVYPAGFPKAETPWLEKNGQVAREWRYLIQALWDRTGAASGIFGQTQGSSGSALMLLDTPDLEEPMVIPGPAGLPGAAGPAGPAIFLDAPEPDEPMMMPPRLLPGGWFDEKGSGGTYGFATGVDFTPNVTTSLTLSQPYSAQANLIVAFDSALQGADQFSLNGKILTFTSAIPNGTQKVYVKGFLPF